VQENGMDGKPQKHYGKRSLRRWVKAKARVDGEAGYTEKKAAFCTAANGGQKAGGYEETFEKGANAQRLGQR